MSKIKLISVTWSYDYEPNLASSRLFRSFYIKNKNEEIYKIHYNRNNYKNLEREFEERFGFQYEFILYRIFLLVDELKKINFDYIIFSDTNDVVCLKNIENFKPTQDILFSSEKHRYPNTTENWRPISDYSEHNKKNGIFLNAGLVFCERIKYIEFLESSIQKVLPLNYKNFGGDQGVFTYYYINEIDPKIHLDENSHFFQNTYLTSPNWFSYDNEIFTNKITNTNPYFLHDNGWNYGSPKIIENFNII